MYAEHPLFQKPGDVNVKIWRYLDFAKFVSLVDKQALFFVRADVLADRFEGSLSKVTVEARPIVYKEKKMLNAIQSFFPRFFKAMRKHTIINSWHINERESAAMWQLYSKDESGIAVQSTFQRLTDSFRKCSDKDVLVGVVKYIDYDTEHMPEGSSLLPFLCKRKSFAHERELRAIVQEHPIVFQFDQKVFDYAAEQSDAGAYIPVHLDVLIENVYVSPTSAEWFLELVKSTVTKYHLEKPVKQSRLSQDPVY